MVETDPSLINSLNGLVETIHTFLKNYVECDFCKAIIRIDRDHCYRCGNYIGELNE